MDAVPVLLWLVEERQRQKQIPFGDDNQKGYDKNHDNRNDNRNDNSISNDNSNDNRNCNGNGNGKSGNGRAYWMVRLMVAVWMMEPPVAVTLTA
jgi:hypothetical protein